MKTLGLYIHLPFCKSKCLYCDFCSFPHPRLEVMEKYTARICEELAIWSERARDYTVDTVYFGGGTPTVMGGDRLSRMLETVTRHYTVARDAEITVECNPRTGNFAEFKTLRRAGFNRVSVGLQSTHPNELKRLGRGHSFDDFCATYDSLCCAGFENISVDVMSGIPEQTVESYMQTLARVCDLSPQHISAYGLIVEEGTPFAILESRGQLILPDEEEARQMYMDGAAYLENRGFGQYEISNFAKAGYESRHNVKYWNCEEYIGFGVAAYSDFCGARFGNSRDLDAYIKGESIECERDAISEAERQNEYVMLRMRLCEGISQTAFAKRFGAAAFMPFEKKLATYESSGLVCRRGDGLAFTREGMYVSNAILSDVLDF
ncbi:MAG: radical SAM family heme chaperone HemW [Clostridia bacterium]|nr:radical SAM family heme chaperone HemW [Clostridia bacterium]